MGGGNSKRQRVLEPYTSFDVLPTEYFNRRAFQQQCTPIPGPTQQSPFLALPIPIPVPCQPQTSTPPSLNCIPQPSSSPPLTQYMIPPPQLNCLPLQQPMCPPGCVPATSSQQNLYFNPPPRVAYPCPPSPSPLCFPGTQSMSSGFGQCGSFNQSQVFNTRPFGYMGQPDRINTLGRQGASASGVNSTDGFSRFSSRNYAPALSHQEIHSVPKFNKKVVPYYNNIGRISRSNMRNVLL